MTCDGFVHTFTGDDGARVRGFIYYLTGKNGHEYVALFSTWAEAMEVASGRFTVVGTHRAITSKPRVSKRNDEWWQIAWQ